MRRRLFKYFSERQWADQMLEGDVLFRALSYFQQCEDSARGDENEGTSVFRPDGGLEITKQDGTKFTLQGSFESTVKAREIFAFCLSRSFTKELASQFGAVACVEIADIPAFCARIKAAAPAGAIFFGGRVNYYDSAAGPEARWALPAQIAVSKLKSFAHEMEFRVGFALNDAFAFENVDIKVIQGQKAQSTDPATHPDHKLNVGRLADIAHIRDL